MAKLFVPDHADQINKRDTHAGNRLRRFLGDKGLASLFSIVMICTVLSPILENWRSKPKDSFPLSYFPMFSRKRSETVRVTYVVGFNARGERHLIPHRFAGTGGFNQVRKQISKVARKGDADKQCEAIVERIALRRNAPFADLVSVQIVTGEYKLADYFAADKKPLQESVHAACEVERSKL